MLLVVISPIVEVGIVLLVQVGVDLHLEERVKKLRVGHPLDPLTEVGPLIHRQHLEKVLGYIDIARTEKATVKIGGDRPPELSAGNYLNPALIIDAANTMRVAREEIFGPVLTTMSFSSEEEKFVEDPKDAHIYQMIQKVIDDIWLKYDKDRNGVLDKKEARRFLTTAIY